MKAFLVTGTDTGIGKTHVATLLARALKKMDFRVGVFKPVETGVTGVPQDALALKESAECCEPVEVVCPYAFADPVAPWIASQKENRPIRFDVIQRTFEHILSKHDLVVVESAGGLLVPIAEWGNYADLAKKLDLGILVVVGLRLGAINHALLTLETARSNGLNILGYVLNEFERDDSPGAQTVEKILCELAGTPSLGRIGFGDHTLQTGNRIAEKVLRLAAA